MTSDPRVIGFTAAAVPLCLLPPRPRPTSVDLAVGKLLVTGVLCGVGEVLVLVGGGCPW